jgi:plasmid maintenance system antidote protein VapI
MSQLALPVKVNPDEVARKKTLGAALELCAEVAGFCLDKELQQRLGVDKAQFSRWINGTEGILWPKFCALMDSCGNDAPLLWMAHQRGYELESMRQRESETERALRVANDALLAERNTVKMLTALINGRSF